MSDWTREDVEHLDVMIADQMAADDDLLALPAVESIRNRIAAEVGIESRHEGGITWEVVRETDYGDHREPPSSEYGT